ncbi:MAG: glycosyltransferase [Planctomycetia bacterium]|nr:glycosyltransferase [Planctomycetia bacterium]
MTAAGPDPALSVIVPALDEGPHVRAHLARIVASVARLGRPFEVVLVDDGSADQTGAEARAAAAADPRVRVVAHARNLGKGAALATGCAEARGEVLVFLDADLEISPDEIGPLLARMDAAGAAVAVGSKYAPGAHEHRPWHRALLSRVYLGVTSVLFRLPIRDTQTGLKALRRDVARALVPALRTRRWAWDVELLLLAHRAGARIVAAPVTVDFRRPGVRIGARGFLDSGLDTLAVFLRDRGLGAYGRAVARAGRRDREARPPTRVVLSGDDLGLCASADRGLLEAAAAGRLTSLSYLADGPTAAAAAAAARRLDPAPDVGVHLDLAALAGGSLARFLVRTLLGGVPVRDVRRAVRDAVGAARARGLVPTHVDAHRHAFLLPSTFRAVVAEAARLGVPGVRRAVPAGPVRCGPGVAGRCKGALLAVAGLATRGLARAYGRVAPEGIVDAAVAAAWAASPRRLPRGTFEVVAHPAAGPDDVPAGERGPDRAADAACLAGLRAALEARGARVVAFGALGRARGAPVG